MMYSIILNIITLALAHIVISNNYVNGYSKDFNLGLKTMNLRKQSLRILKLRGINVSTTVSFTVGKKY